ncbi:MAG: LURP-one-related family protein [Ktedonobacteraceae bacterium]
MKFHIKKQAWTLQEKFTVQDEGGTPVFEIKGKFFHIGDNLVVHDLGSHEEVAHIKQKVVALTPHYEIYHKGKQWVGLHEKLFHFSGERFKIKQENGEFMHIAGNLWEWNFSVNNERGDLLMQVGQNISLFNNSYGIEVAQGVDVPLVIALTIAFEMICSHQAKKEDAS